MKKKYMALVGVVLLIILAVPIYFLGRHFYDQRNTSDNDFTYIKMSRGRCYGTCPMYTIEISANGDVKYTGIGFVGVIGEKKYKLSDGQLNELQDAVDEAKFFSLEDRYVAEVTDLPSTTTLVKTSKREKSVYNYVGAPMRLEKLERKIDEITGTVDLTKCDNACRSK